MQDLVILRDDIIIPLSMISDSEVFDPSDPNLMFFSDGRIRRFKKNGKAYMAIFYSETNLFRGYYLEDNFWDNNTRNTKRNETEAIIDTLGSPFIYLPIASIVSDSRVILSHKEITDNNYPAAGSEVHLEVKSRFIPYAIANINPGTINFDHPTGYPVIKNSLSIYSLLTPYLRFVVQKKYMGDNGQLRDLTDMDVDELYDICYVLDVVFSDNSLMAYLQTKGLLAPFTEHINLPSRYNTIPFGQIDPDYHILYNEEYFSRYRLQLVDFRYWLLRYKEDYSKIDVNDLTVYIVNIFPREELCKLSYDIKVNLLNKILLDNLWVIGNWYFNKLNEEQAIIKIIRSISNETNRIPNYTEIDKFFDLLGSTYNHYTNYTLYEVLYDKIDDTTLFDDSGNGNKGQLVKAIYNLWIASKFNPNHEVKSIAIHALTLFNYTNYTADWQYEDTSILIAKTDYSAAPPLLSYESEKELLWYRDTLDFEFYDHKILVRQIKGYKSIGYYNFFQPVALKSTDYNDTIVRMPVMGISDINDVNNETFINNCVPIFYLKYVDDLGDYSDAKQTIGVIVNVVLFVTGIGELANLRLLTNFSLLKNLFNGVGLTAAEGVEILKAVGYVTFTAQTISSLVNFFYNLATDNCTNYYNHGEAPASGTPNYAKYNFCQDLNKWLFAFDMVTLSADALAKRALKRASQRLIQSIPPDIEATIPLSQKNALVELADISQDIENFLNDIQNSHPQVYSKLMAIKANDENKAYEFVMDFKGNSTALNQLETTPALIDTWNEVKFLKPYKNDVDYLKKLKVIVDDTELQKHVHNGDAYLEYAFESDGVTYKPSTANVTGYHNPDKLVSPPPGMGEISWKRQPQNSNPTSPLDGYTQGKIQRNMSDLIDESTGQPWKVFNSNPPVHLKTKGASNVFWPTSYTTERINEEMALAYRNMNISTGTSTQNAKGIITWVYESKASDGHIIEIMFYGGDYKTGELKSIYPQYF